MIFGSRAARADICLGSPTMRYRKESQEMSPVVSLIIAALVSAVVALICYIVSLRSGKTAPTAFMTSGGAYLGAATLCLLVLEYLR